MATDPLSRLPTHLARRIFAFVEPDDYTELRAVAVRWRNFLDSIYAEFALRFDERHIRLQFDRPLDYLPFYQKIVYSNGFGHQLESVRYAMPDAENWNPSTQWPQNLVIRRLSLHHVEVDTNLLCKLLKVFGKRGTLHHLTLFTCNFEHADNALMSEMLQTCISPNLRKLKIDNITLPSCVGPLMLDQIVKGNLQSIEIYECTDVNYLNLLETTFKTDGIRLKITFTVSGDIGLMFKRKLLELILNWPKSENPTEFTVITLAYSDFREDPLIAISKQLNIVIADSEWNLQHTTHADLYLRLTRSKSSEVAQWQIELGVRPSLLASLKDVQLFRCDLSQPSDIAGKLSLTPSTVLRLAPPAGFTLVGRAVSAAWLKYRKVEPSDFVTKEPISLKPDMSGSKKKIRLEWALIPEKVPKTIKSSKLLLNEIKDSIFRTNCELQIE